jgi:C-terminal processing protease CtpA/Prc
MGEQTKWAEKAARSSRDSWKNLITSRIDIALERVNRDNSEYIELCQQQEKDERIVDMLLKKLDKEEHDIVRQYYDKEIEKENYELEETYMQGVKDGIWFLLGLEVLQVKELP